MYRLIELLIPKDKKEKIEKLFEEEKNNIIDYWPEEILSDKIIYKILIKTELSQYFIDKIQNRMTKEDYFRITVLDVSATIPTPETPKKIGKLSISREELYSKVLSFAECNYVYIIMVILSTIIAAFGLLENNTAVIIGAMVIAPLLGPNIVISLGTVLGDLDLAKKGFLAGFIGIVIAFCLAVILGVFLHVNPQISGINTRTHVQLSDIAIAISSGIAGVLAFTTGTSILLVGVMVAISLLPPLVTAGLLIGNGYYLLSIGAVLLFLINLISLNLAGIITFLFQGIRPKNWWEEKKAKIYRQKAIAIWIIMLIILIIAVYFNHKHF